MDMTWLYTFDEDAVRLAGKLARLDEATFPYDAMTEEEWRKALTGKQCVVVHNDGFTAAGVMVWASEVAYLYSNAVMEEFRGRGLGAQILVERVGIARMQGCRVIHAYTRVGNSVSQFLLRQCGFVETEYVPDFYDDFGDDAIKWERRL